MTFQETGVKFIVLATALLAPTLAFAQGAAPAPAQAQAPAAAPAPRPAKPPAAPKKAAHAAQAQAGIEMLEVSQVLGLRQIDPATYEIGVRLQNGKEVHLRANAFVLQSLGQLLGTYGQAR